MADVLAAIPNETAVPMSEVGHSADNSDVPLLLVKGGSSLELRRGIPDSRTSKDFDTVARRDIEEVHEQLAEAGEAGGRGSPRSSPSPRRSMFQACP